MSKKIYLESVIQELDFNIKNKALSYFGTTSLVEANENSPHIWAAELSSDKKIIEADIILDDDNDEVIFYRCDCKNANVCEHVAAALMVIKAKLGGRSTSPRQSFGMPPKISEPTVSKVSVFAHTQVEAIYEVYKKLPLDEARMTKCAALIYEPFTLANIQIVFETAFLPYQKKLQTADVKILLNSLISKNLLVLSKSGTYQIKSALADYICLEDYKNDKDFALAASKIEVAMPFTTWSWNGNATGERAFRNMRLAFHAGEIDKFKIYFNKTLELVTGHSPQTLKEYFIGSKFDKKRLETAAPAIREELIYIHLFLCLSKFAPLDEFYNYAVEYIIELSSNELITPHLIERLLDVAIFRADWITIDKLAPKLDAYNLGWITGTKQILAGNAVKALDTFDITQKAYRKATRSTKAFLRNSDAVFQLIARFGTKNPALYGDISEHLDKLRKIQNSYSPIFSLLEDGYLTLINNKKAAVQHLRGLRPNSSLHSFFLFVVMYWVDKYLLDTSRVTELYTRAEKGGYLWVKAELSEIMHRLMPQSQSWELKAKEDLHSYQLSGISYQQEEIDSASFPLIIDTFPQIEEWENALNALFSIASSHKPTAKENDTRVIWLVDFEKKVLEAKEQTFGKSGWSVGRIVSAPRFVKNEVKNVTEQDRKIVKNLYKLENTHWGGATYFTNFDEGIAHLAGHPLLFLQKSPTVAVQLLEEKPSLVAKQTGEGNIEIKFSHDFEGEGYTVTKETPTRYKLLNISPEYARIADAMNGKKLSIPNVGRERVQQVIAQLSGIVDIQTSFDSDNDALPMIEADARICVHLLPIGDGFHVELYTKPFKTSAPYFKPGEGEPTIIGEADGVRVRSKRDLNLEEKNEKKLIKEIPILSDNKPQKGTWELEDAEMCLELLLELETPMRAQEINLEWPKGEKFRITKVGGFNNFSMSVKEKNNWFEITGEMRVDENLVLDMRTLIELSEKQKGQFIELSPGKFLALTKEFRRRLKEISAYMNPQKNGAMQMHALAVSALQPFADAMEMFNTDKKYKDSIKKLKDAHKKSFTVPENFNAELREYQREGYVWLQRCAAWGVGVCLADDMGLGKTIQALAFLVDRADNGPALVVAPTSVCRNWLMETEKFAPTLKAILFGEGDRQAMIEQAGPGDIVVTTYDLMTRESEAFSKKKFHTIILDEAQAIKNRSTKRSETAMQLQGDFKMAMTGTPLENHLGELWNLFQFINPGLLGSIERFNDKFAAPIEKYGDDSRRKQLKNLVQPFMLRRRKDEVLKELPAKTEIILSVDLTPEERAFYEALRRKALASLENGPELEGGKKHLQILAEISRLRRAACHPRLVDENADFIESSKLRMFGEVVDELLDNGHKALVFSQFVTHLSILRKYLDDKNIRYQYLDGSTPMNKRQDNINAFQKGDGDLFLISLKAGGVGLNLTAADYVIHMDPWWNPAVEDQATDRAHRIGQEKPVTVYRIVTTNTIEEKIIKMHESKRDLADSLLSGGDVSARLNADELLALLRNN